MRRRVPEGLLVHQRCFSALVGVDEIDVLAHQREARRALRASPEAQALAVQRAEARAAREMRRQLFALRQADFWPEDRPPAGRPRSLFARKPLSRLEQAFGKSLADDPVVPRPASRPDCLGKDVPCPFVRCRHHLAIDVNEIGSLKLNFPDWTAVDLDETCSLNVASRGGQTVETVARLMNLSTERIRQIEREAWRKMARLIDPGRLLRGIKRP